MIQENVQDQNMAKRYALFTSTSDEFFAGTCVALFSFIKHNPWFDSDIVVVSENLSEDRRKQLEKIFAQVKVHSVDTRLVEKAEELKTAFSSLGNRVRIFYNLHLFTLKHYDRIVKIDSDMLFRGSVKHLFELDSDFAACHAMTYYLDKSRHQDDLSLVDHDDPNALPVWVNAGLYSVSSRFLNDATFDRLISYMATDVWAQQKSNHTDQIAINLTFGHNLEILPQKYNYLIAEPNVIADKTGSSMQEALVWHYIGQRKPWLLNDCVASSLENIELLLALREWANQYIDYIQYNHMLTKRLSDSPGTV